MADNGNMNEEEILDVGDDNIITLTDEDGVDCNFELIDTLEVDGKDYMVLAPLEDAEEGEVVIFSVETDDEGGEYYEMLEGDEAQRIFDIFVADDNEDYSFGDAE